MLRLHDYNVFLIKAITIFSRTQNIKTPRNLFELTFPMLFLFQNFQQIVTFFQSLRSHSYRAWPWMVSGAQSCHNPWGWVCQRFLWTWRWVMERLWFCVSSLKKAALQSVMAVQMMAAYEHARSGNAQSGLRLWSLLLHSSGSAESYWPPKLRLKLKLQTKPSDWKLKLPGLLRGRCCRRWTSLSCHSPGQQRVPPRVLPKHHQRNERRWLQLRHRYAWKVDVSKKIFSRPQNSHSVDDWAGKKAQTCGDHAGDESGIHREHVAAGVDCH